MALLILGVVRRQLLQIILPHEDRITFQFDYSSFNAQPQAPACSRSGKVRCVGACGWALNDGWKGGAISMRARDLDQMTNLCPNDSSVKYARLCWTFPVENHGFCGSE
jgi:hypothetical protein